MPEQGKTTPKQSKSSPREEGFASHLGGSLSLGEAMPEKRRLRQENKGFDNPLGKFIKPWRGYARALEDYAKVLEDYATPWRVSPAYRRQRLALGGLRQDFGRPTSS